MIFYARNIHLIQTTRFVKAYLTNTVVSTLTVVKTLSIICTIEFVTEFVIFTTIKNNLTETIMEQLNVLVACEYSGAMDKLHNY
jgi:hypothetical protein